MDLLLERSWYQGEDDCRCDMPPPGLRVAVVDVVTERGRAREYAGCGARKASLLVSADIVTIGRVDLPRSCLGELAAVVRAWLPARRRWAAYDGRGSRTIVWKRDVYVPLVYFRPGRRGGTVIAEDDPGLPRLQRARRRVRVVRADARHALPGRRVAAGLALSDGTPLGCVVTLAPRLHAVLCRRTLLVTREWSVARRWRAFVRSIMEGTHPLAAAIDQHGRLIGLPRTAALDVAMTAVVDAAHRDLAPRR